jgi:hypothetical protein
MKKIEMQSATLTQVFLKSKEISNSKCIQNNKSQYRGKDTKTVSK